MSSPRLPAGVASQLLRSVDGWQASPRGPRFGTQVSVKVEACGDVAASVHATVLFVC